MTLSLGRKVYSYYLRNMANLVLQCLRNWQIEIMLSELSPDQFMGTFLFLMLPVPRTVLDVGSTIWHIS